MRLLQLVVAAGLIAGGLAAQTNPVPLVNNPLVPDSAAPGSGGFTLTVNGTGFVSASVVNWNGSPRATAFVNRSQVTATILASDVASAGTASVSVTSPTPGGGRSNVAFFTVAAAESTVAMAVASSYAIPGVYVVATGDLNGDGKLDLVASPVATVNGNEVAVLLGNGDGSFQTPAMIALPNYLLSVIIGDFNNDGKPDIAANGCCAVWVLMGNGDGTFQPYKTTSEDAGYSVAGDFNADGKLDIASVNGNRVAILLGNGDGTFSGFPSYTLPNDQGNALVTAGFNRDGHLDLAIASGSGVYVLLGNGDGTFQAPVLVPGEYYSVATADFNDDGTPDLAAYGYRGAISVLLGKGNGSFKAAVDYRVGLSAGQLVAGDFNGDGHVDVAASDVIYGGYSLAILAGNGDGTFQAAQTTDGPNYIYGLAAGDFNGDGRLDLVATQNENELAINLQSTASLAPGLLSFPATLVKTTSAPQTVTLTNFGASALNVSQVALSGTNASEFTISSNTCQGAAVVPGGNCTLSVSFAPTANNTQAALLTITDNASVTQQTVALTGNGTVVSLTPGHLDFGSVARGSISSQQIITARNTSTATIDIHGITMVGKDPKDYLVSNTCGGTLRPHATCSIVVQFIPTKAGSRTAAVYINLSSGTPTNPKNIPVSGTGT